MTGHNRHCFTYGSLMTPHIMFEVCGMKPAAIPATLEGHRRHPVRGEDYPGIVTTRGHAVSGMLYLDVPPAALARLDAFEGEQYQRSGVTVVDAAGRQLAAEAYVFRPEYADLLLPGDWDVAAFEREGRQRFELKFVGNRGD
ncbi:MAG: gamma-glutamylcyclotransferase [Azoarcus sp. PHD]|nr:MAG: gamma-glutamylcyclotransferase [Azoarcus sp. PHD]